VEESKIVSGYRPYIKRHSFPKVRCSFWLLAWANGCFYDCAYCWLRAYHPWSWIEIHVAEKPVLARVLRRFCSKTPRSHLLNAGELCDSFIAPEYIPFMASELRRANEEYGRRHRLLLLTKSADPGVVLQGPYQDVVVYSASVNTETNAKQLEHGAPSPNKRIHAAMRVKEAGYEVRVRVDPIIAGSEPAYIGLMERICAFIEPSLVTLGCLRATPRTYRFLPATIRTRLTERTPWGRGYPIETRISIYNELITVARDHDTPVALCKEPPDVWRSLRLKGRCNCTP
jgi:DNA repair photolyase